MELCRKPFVSPPPTGYCGKFENISAKQSDEQTQPQKGTNKHKCGSVVAMCNDAISTFTESTRATTQSKYSKLTVFVDLVILRG